MILVTAATGNVGAPLVAELADPAGKSEEPDSPRSVRVLTRDPSRAHFPDGVQVMTGSSSDRADMAAALEGADAVFLNLVGDPQPGLDALADVTPRRVVLLSSLSAGTRPDLSYARHFAELEDAVRQVAPQVCVLRPGQFASNVGWWRPMLPGGVVYAPFLDVGVPTIAPEDIASVAVRALLSDDYAGQTLVLSGPEVITPRRQIAAIAAVSGRTLAAAEVSEEQFRARDGFGPEAAEYLVQVMGHPRAEEVELSSSVEDVTGRQPLSFEAWLRRHPEAFG